MTEKLTRFGLICLCALPVWAIVRKPWKRPWRRECTLGLFVAYIAALLVMALEEEYDVEIPTEDLEQLTTVQAVVNYLKEKGIEV